MPIQEDSKIKESQNEEHLDGSGNTKEQNVPKIGKGKITKSQVIIESVSI